MNESIDISLIIGILLTMAFSAFFSGTEIAFVSSNRMLFEVDKERHGLSTRLINFFYRHPNDFVSTMLVGNNVVLVIYGILIARLFDNFYLFGLCSGLYGPCGYNSFNCYYALYRRISAENLL